MNVRRFMVAAAGMLAGGAIVAATMVVSASPAEAASRKYRPTMSMSTTRIHTGDPVVIKGKVNMYRGSSHKVYLQYRYNENGRTSWKTLRALTTSKSGSYSTTTRPSSSRDRDYRIYKPAGAKAKKGYSKTIHVHIAPAVTTKTVTIKFATVEQQNPTLNMCTRNIVTHGVDGKTIYTYLDGKLGKARTVTVAPVTQVVQVGTSTQPCVTGFQPGKAVEGAPVTVTISGHNLAGATAVSFGDQTGTIDSATDTTVAASGPALPAGTAPLALLLADIPVTVGDFTVVAKPTISSIDVDSGSLSGGETITVTGTTLASTSKVTFIAKGTTEAPLDDGPVLPAKFTVVDDTTVKVTAPAGVGGPADIKLVTDYGTVTLPSSYTYKAVARDGSTFERQLFDEINKRRLAGATCGPTKIPPAPALAWNGAASDLARSHVADIDARYQLYGDSYEYFFNWHGTPGLPSMLFRFYLAGLDFEVFSEILARTPSSDSAAEVVDGWVASQSHCNTLMSPRYTSAGSGAVVHDASGVLLSVVDFQ